jgi:hypothetical protein
MKETVDDFFDRIWVNFNTYPAESYALVWKSKNLKQDLNSKIKPEKMSIESVREYIKYLEDGR